MNWGTKIPYFFRKYPFFRLAVYLVVIGAGLFIVMTLSFPRIVPVIDSINPPIASSGDILVVQGRGFGDNRDTGVVIIGGSAITASRYLSWNDTEIRLMLPPNVRDGLVTVETARGTSGPKMFANAANIPVAAPPGNTTALPGIATVRPAAAYPGELLTITGSNFGSLRGESAALFTPAYSGSMEIAVEYISGSSADYDYEYWSDSEIRVRVPDGAATGSMYVKTGSGASNPQRITVLSPVGTKQFVDGRVYVLHFNADVSDAMVSEPAALILRMPCPQLSSSQPKVEVQAIVPEPMTANFSDMIIHQVQLDQLGGNKLFFTHTFIVPVYGVTTEVNPAQARPYTDTTRLLYAAATAPDTLIQSNTADIIALAQSIVQKETNPYTQAKLLYDYLLDTYTLLQETRPGNSDPYDMLATRRGDSYDFAILFCALCRALKIPAIPIAGVIVDSSRETRSHWWCEVYLERFGWFPVDPGLGAGLAFTPFGRTPGSPRQFYFGSLDSWHIGFSRGWKAVKPAIPNSKNVYRPRTYAFQSIWEESSPGARQYSSFWSEPIIAGIY